jgi:pimeloyl-ACP methyl ester carboxylesterase
MPARPLADIAALEAFADDLVVDVVDAFDLAQVDVVATSFGGYFMFRGAAAHPARVRRLVELSWTFGAPAATTPLVMRIANLPSLGRLMTKIPPNERMVRSLLRQIGLRQAVDSGRFGPVEVAWYLALLRDTETMRNEIDSVPRVTTLRGFSEATLLSPATLGRVVSPVLLLWGEEDPMGGEALARRFADALPDATLELMADAGHAPWIDDPAFVATRVQEFLDPLAGQPFVG